MAPDTPLEILMIGDTPEVKGGVMAFCERSIEALEEHGRSKVTHEFAHTAFLPIRRLPWLIFRLAKLFRPGRKRYDGVWVQYVNLPDLLYVVAAKLAGYKVMVTPHLGSNWRSQQGILRGVSGLLASFADRFALISPTQEQEIILSPIVPRSAVRNFLPKALWAEPVPPPNSGTELQLIHSSRLSAGKGTFLVVELCAALRDAGVPIKCWITGGADQATMDQLHGMITDLQVGEIVTVLGRVSDDDLLNRLRASDVLVHLSKIDSYPLIILEALSCGGVFPLCMELAGARDMVDSYAGKIVSQETPVAEAAAFLAAADPAQLRAEANAAAERVREDYDWRNCVTLVEQAFLETFGDRRVR